MEETGLTADMAHESVFHKLDISQTTKELLEDKIFFMIRCTNIQGDLIEEFEGGRNAWMTLEDYAAQPLTFADTKESFEHNLPMITIVEDRWSYDPEHY